MNFSINFEVQRILSNFPLSYKALVQLRNRTQTQVGIDKEMVSQKTDLVIEAFPRCANTFFTMAIYLSQKKKINLANHYHSTAQILLALKYNKPIVTIIREPIPAISSLIIRHPKISQVQALKSYIQFYECILKNKHKILIVNFDDATKNLNVCINRINNKFRMNLQQTVNEQFEDDVFDAIKCRNKSFNNNQLNESTIAIPNKKREKIVFKFDDNIKTSNLLKCAESIFLELKSEIENNV